MIKYLIIIIQTDEHEIDWDEMKLAIIIMQEIKSDVTMIGSNLIFCQFLLFGFKCSL
jgi:hypothetical protein